MTFSMSLRGSRGQTGHVFTFIVAMIVIAATIWIAGVLIKGLGETACDAELSEFRSSFRQSLSANSVYGSRNLLAVHAPCGASQLCFVDHRIVEEASRGVPHDRFHAQDPRINITVKQGAEANLFLLAGEELYPLYDERVILSRPEDPPPERAFCIPAAGVGFSFATEGYGRFILIGQG